MKSRIIVSEQAAARAMRCTPNQAPLACELDAHSNNQVIAPLSFLLAGIEIDSAFCINNGANQNSASESLTHSALAHLQS